MSTRQTCSEWFLKLIVELPWLRIFSILFKIRYLWRSLTNITIQRWAQFPQSRQVFWTSMPLPSVCTSSSTQTYQNTPSSNLLIKLIKHPYFKWINDFVQLLNLSNSLLLRSCPIHLQTFFKHPRCGRSRRHIDDVSGDGCDWFEYILLQDKHGMFYL